LAVGPKAEPARQLGAAANGHPAGRTAIGASTA